MATIRTFVAVTMAGSLHKTLGEVIDKFSSSKASVKWVEPHNAHLTLKFLGNVEEARLAEVFAACEKAAKGFKPIDLEVRAVGCFPSMKRPRVVWLGIEKGAEAIRQLQQKVESELERIGFPREDKDFKAHLTIGRVKGQQGVQRLCGLLEEERNVFIGSMRAEKLSVMKSQPLSTGPVYTEMKAIPLE
ncbi:RNA 2',3'-cyclic phosphodiesterase [Candidatus Poribacteria bacterium]|nr:RNA 2',3'-cyclic phosphodiesterase [Candidatus Poribacteria bacterium]